jgi:LPXTG-motif cell wall-anchored protein
LAIVAVSVLVSGPAVALLSSSPAQAASPILLGTSGSFAVLAGSGITNTGPTTIAGDVGTFETTTMTGFDSVTLDGVNHGGDAVTQQAKDDLTTAYNQAAASGPPNAVATELGGTTLTPGVYRSDTLGITGTLTLDTQGDPYAVFVFQAASTLTTATDSAVVILGGGEACNVFWQVGSSATLGTRAHLVGTVLAATSITATTGATVEGRLLASAGAVTLDTNTLTGSVCTTAATTTTTTGTGGSTTIPGSAVPTATGTGTPTGANVPPGGGVPLLPYTGFDSGDLAVVGIGLLGIGASALHVSRRRRQPLHAIQ